MAALKEYKVPFISVLVLLVLFVVYSSLTIQNSYALSPELMFRHLLRVAIIMIVLIAEVFLYWRFRSFIYNRAWAIIHVISIYFAWMLLPILFQFIVFMMIDRVEPGNAAAFFIPLARINMTVYWAALIIGHIFFILLIKKSVQLKKAYKNNAEDLFPGFPEKSE